MKKISSKTILNVMSFTVFALMLASSYFDHKEEIDESIKRLKETLAKAKEAKAEETETAETSAVLIPEEK